MIGQNENFKKVIVSNTNLLASAGSTYDLTNGQIGIFNADTYAADATPTWAEEKTIIVAQGTPDLSDIPAGAGVANDTNKSKPIIGKKIIAWRKKVASAGTTNIVTAGYTGAVNNYDTFAGKCDEIQHLYMRLTGKPIEDFIPGGYLIHVQAQGPCCDTCGDNCADVDGAIFRDQIYDRLMEHTVLGGLSLTKFVIITKTDGLAADGVTAIYGLKFESGFVDRVTDLCYFDLFPYNAEPIYMEISTFDPDWHASRCQNPAFVTTQIQDATYPFGDGQWLMRYEASMKGFDLQGYSDNHAIRKAYGQYLNTDPNVNYDKYTLVFDFSYNVGMFSQIYNDRYELEVFVQTGQTAYATAINAYITSVTGLGVATV